MNKDDYLYHIVDVLQCQVVVDLEQDKGGISGGTVANVRTQHKGLVNKFHIKPTAIITKEQVGVMFSVMGDLSVLASYNGESLTTSVFLLDRSKGDGSPPESKINREMTLKQAVSAVKSMLVSAYYLPAGGRWLPFSME